MTIGVQLRAHLLADASIAALVAARIYPLRLPQAATFPAIVITRISELRYDTLNATGTLARPRYQVDSWARTHDGATALGALCRRRLDGFTGTWADEESPTNEIRVAIRFEAAVDLFEEDVQGGLCRNSSDYYVSHGTAGGVV